MPTPHPKPASALPRDLLWARVLTLGPVALIFPLGAAAVFGLGADRDSTADVIALTYSIGLFAAFTSAFWPLPGIRTWSSLRRIESTCLLFVIVSCLTHLSWEAVWLLFHEAIIEARDSPWAYAWWAYIDGGDRRYAEPDSTLFVMEALSVVNGIVGTTGLVRWYRSNRTDAVAVLLFMAMAVVHLYSTSLYFGGELLEGLPNVDTSSFIDTWFKFGLANLPWLVFPWFVLFWGAKALPELFVKVEEIDP